MAVTVVPWVGELILHLSRNEHLLAAKANTQFSEDLDLHSGFVMHSVWGGGFLFVFAYNTERKSKKSNKKVLFHVQRYVGRVGYVIIFVCIQRTNISPAPSKKEILTDFRSLAHCAQQMIEFEPE